MTLVEDVAARLRAQVSSRTTFEYAVSDGPIPPAYLLVRATPATESGERMTETTDHVDWILWVLSVARHPDPFKSARTADVGASMVRDALRDYRPSAGPWRLRFDVGQSAFRDESLSDTTFSAAVQYAVRVNL